MAELEDAAVAELAVALEAFEGDVSDERRRLFAELDDLSDELVRRYREQQPPGDPDE